MGRLVWSSRFIRDFKRLVRRNPQMRSLVEQLETDAFDPRLRTHKLKGSLSDTWACSVDYSNRILFDFVMNQETDEEEIYLLTLGSHDDVY